MNKLLIIALMLFGVGSMTSMLMIPIHGHIVVGITMQLLIYAATAAITWSVCKTLDL